MSTQDKKHFHLSVLRSGWGLGEDSELLFQDGAKRTVKECLSRYGFGYLIGMLEDANGKRYKKSSYRIVTEKDGVRLRNTIPDQRALFRALMRAVFNGESILALPANPRVKRKSYTFFKTTRSMIIVPCSLARRVREIVFRAEKQWGEKRFGA